MAWELLSGHVLCLWNHPLWLASRPLSPSWTASGGHPLEADPPREVLQWFSGPKEYTSLFWLLIKMSFFTKRFWQTFEGADLGVGYVFVYFCFSIYFLHTILWSGACYFSREVVCNASLRRQLNDSQWSFSVVCHGDSWKHELGVFFIFHYQKHRAWRTWYQISTFRQPVKVIIYLNLSFLIRNRI